MRPDFFAVPVTGGALRVARWGEAGPVVVAAHGITSSLRFWSAIAEELAGHAVLVAPDLRGRGDSAALGGPYGMAAHADDLTAVCDHLDVERAVVVGHSMGAFVATTMAVHHSERVAGLVLADGGLALTGPLPPGVSVEAVLHGIIGPSLERLDRTFASRDEYRAFWQGHPAFAGADIRPTHVDAYADHDLTGEPPRLRSKVAPDAVRADAADTLVNADVRAAIGRLDCPAVLLWASRGVMNQPTGLYTRRAVEAAVAANPRLRAELVADTNHFSIGLGRSGAAVVARHIRAAAGLPEDT